MDLLASFFTIHSLPVLVATIIASLRGWNHLPFILLGPSQLPRVTPLTGGPAILAEAA